eukprot:ANDGO_01678.mRNA.1 Pre-rRNA-processing protein esf1
MLPDARFSKIATDPRFRKTKSSSENHKTDDSRFSSKKLVDLKPLERPQKHVRDVQRSLNGATAVAVPRHASEDDSDSDSDSDSESESVQRKVNQEPEEGEKSQGSSESSHESSDSDDPLDDVEFEDDSYAVLYGDLVVKKNCETRRLAVENLDWENMSARDIHVILESFVPSTGHVLRVSVYPSDFGEKMMELEARKGPQLGVSAAAADLADGADENEVDQTALRKYEVQKLRYYYAIAECDSVETGSKIYDECDGLEVEASSNVLDLRFVPDDVKFNKKKPRDVSVYDDLREMDPSKYKAPKFATKALQSSKVELTWERTDPKRTAVMTEAVRRKWSKEKEIEDDLNAFIGSGSDDDDDDDDGGQSANDSDSSSNSSSNSDSDSDSGSAAGGRKKTRKAKYRDLIKALDKEAAQEDKMGDMQVTFQSGLKDVGDRLAKKMVDKEKKAAESTWETYLRERNEKKKGAKKQAKEFKKGARKSDLLSSSDASGSDNDDDDLDMEDFEEIEEQNRLKNAAKSKSSSKKDKNKKSSKKRGAMDEDDDDEEEARERAVLAKPLNAADERFAGLIHDPDFAMDPTAPQFKKMKKSEGVQEIMQRRRNADAKKRKVA